jgi:3-deoxy-manno-octulosonate cytidylyltransferase (CMP-KDO synthetase)
MSDPIIIIPARMASVRLPGKPLADIGGKPMIVQVALRAKAANVGRVVVACSEQEVQDAVTAEGLEAVMTDPDLPSGTDRIYAAYKSLGVKDASAVVNVQGDLPTLSPEVVTQTLDALKEVQCDISTAVSEMIEEEEKTNPNVVKAIVAWKSETQGTAMYFTRATAPYGEGKLWHHIGLYAYKPEALERFTQLPPSGLEKQERLEQLRAMEAGMVIGVAKANMIPFGVDTPEDLERARAVYKNA